ncbi:LuxR C-terminal-related transcriptional regulator [Sandaracinobacter sp. RS1-74]|uniref:LuxR C-terminal-related transcriptional regulator n=1 Tax=Sandaracinobacteroides sayramensis TaxID=2913411 RepID=UPI001EDC6C41|nr:LuxR C-terminal-related transcriptional regulator [Sandaracinobacteroides sayramensis]MCG2842618.1 LuxR C-terminal-related transcriptional regulator [Sandaracinobacteroides sayramensis]
MTRILSLSQPSAGLQAAPTAAKLRPPRRQAFHIERPHILAEMQSPPGAVTLLTGPPGCGKTTALADHFALGKAQGRRILWLSLGRQEDDVEGMCDSLLLGFCGGEIGMEANLRPPENTDIYVDGLEAIHDPGALALIEGFLLDVPASSRCYASVHNLRGGEFHYGRLRGLVRSVPHALFRLSDAEAMQMLGPEWHPWDIQKLNQICDGWAAGLRFMALDPAAARKLLNDDRGKASIPVEMAGYFDDVVCASLSEEELAALMDASVLERFTAEALTGVPDCRCTWRLIEDHVRSGIFVHYLDEARRWVAFHPAFGRHMRHRLRCLDPARFDSLQKFAASWFQKNGFAVEAIRHASQLTDPVLSARIMEDAGALLAELGNGPFLNCEKPIPVEQAAGLPMAFLSQIYLQVRTGRIVEARQAFEQVRTLTRGFTDFGQGTNAGTEAVFARIIETVLDITEDRAVDNERIATLEDMLTRYVGTNPVTAASVASLLAISYIELCRYSEAATVCDIGMNALRELGSTKVAIFLRIHQAAVALACETVSKAVLYIEDGCRLAHAESDFGRYEVLTTQILRAELHYEANELEMARALLDQSVPELNGIGGWLSLRASAFTVAASIAGMEGGYEAADDCLRQGEQFARLMNLPRLEQLLLIARMREYTRAGMWREATALLERADYRNLIDRENMSFAELRFQLPALLETARFLVELGRPTEAAAYLERVNKAFLEESDVRLRFTFRLLAMRIAFSVRRYNAAVEHMLVALELAVRAGLLRRAVTNRAAILEVYDWSVRNGRKHPVPVSRFVNDVLRGADASECGSVILNRRPRHGPAAVTPNFTLSPRETEIMVLIAEGYMTKEIATRLVISEGTVKTHRKKIHEKLGVLSKSQAIARARELLII